MEDEENDVYIGSHKDLYATSFVDEEFLSTGLTKENALEYFRRSPFYSEGDLVELEGSDSSESCEFFKIVKYRKDEQEKDGVALLAVYYVLRGTIYQCPDLYSLLKYRMYNCVSLLNQSYTELKKYVSFSVANGHRIESAPVLEKEEEESDVCSVIPLIGEANALQRNEENQLRLDSMIQDMEKQFQVA
ncbi:hypothetical protein BLSTO_00088 [Blastocystis sp. subtype 1]